MRKKLKIAVLGGGITGLVASYRLAKKNHSVCLYEKEDVLGGLASGFMQQKWNWPLEKTYHHIFTNDSAILALSKEIGFNKFFFSNPETVSLYQEGSNYRTIPLDSPQDLLRFPYLGLSDKVRTGLILAFLKFSPFLSYYESKTAMVFLKQTMGEGAWRILWEQLFRKKFGKYAENILASFFWARITKRTSSLGYPTGGFQSFVDRLAHVSREAGVLIEAGAEIQKVHKKNNDFLLEKTTKGKHTKEGVYDVVLSTLPTPVFINIGKDLFPHTYINSLRKINHLHAVSAIFESDTAFFKKEYWVNVSDSQTPVMAMVQHSNLIKPKHYGNKHILYMANYIDGSDWLFHAGREEVLGHYKKQLNRIVQKKTHITNAFLFRASYAQPVFDKIFLKNRSTIETPVKNIFIANLESTYPYDRGTNYAVVAGQKASEIIDSV